MSDESQDDHVSFFKRTDTFFSKPVLALIVAALALLVAVLQLQKMNEDHKEITETEVYSRDLVKVDSDILDNVEVIYKGKSAKQMILFGIRIENTGYAAIEKSSFDDSMSFTFGDDIDVVDVEITEAKPPNLRVKPIISGTNITILPLLLNRGDGFVFEATLVSQSDDASSYPYQSYVRISSGDTIKGSLLDTDTSTTSRFQWLRGAVSCLLALVIFVLLLFIAQAIFGRRISFLSRLISRG
mgnify:CR=1 FL=1